MSTVAAPEFVTKPAPVSTLAAPQLVINSRMIYSSWIRPIRPPRGPPAPGPLPAENRQIYMNQYVVDSEEQTSGFGAYSLTYLGLDLAEPDRAGRRHPGTLLHPLLQLLAGRCGVRPERGVPASPGDHGGGPRAQAGRHDPVDGVPDPHPGAGGRRDRRRRARPPALRHPDRQQAAGRATTPTSASWSILSSPVGRVPGPGPPGLGPAAGEPLPGGSRLVLVRAPTRSSTPAASASSRGKRDPRDSRDCRDSRDKGLSSESSCP